MHGGVPFGLWHHQAAIVYNMVLTICAVLHTEWGRGKHAAAVADIILVMMAIRVNDGAGLPPISISAIAKRLGMSRTSVRRAINEIIEHNGAICKCSDGYCGDPNYVTHRPDADDYLPEIQDAIKNAAVELAALQAARPAGPDEKVARGPKLVSEALAARDPDFAEQANRFRDKADEADQLAMHTKSASRREALRGIAESYRTTAEQLDRLAKSLSGTSCIAKC
ncbi:helix-turn-helix domain-containing protein [Bradyrhizobium sp. DASA03120]|uniref:helix-turn-helix domain-containing protein n=1 Tax=Bradyrhizobium sp. SMVTL-02 TaxID=3395917 RepID=UPI003F6F24E5